MKKATELPNTNMISQTLLSDLRTIVKEDYGVTLEPQDLSDFANNLVNFFELLIKINTIEGGDKNAEEIIVKG